VYVSNGCLCATSKYLPAQCFSLAEAVPGIEEDCPCISRVAVIRKSIKGSCGVWAWWESPLRKLSESRILAVVLAPYIFQFLNQPAELAALRFWDPALTHIIDHRRLLPRSLHAPQSPHPRLRTHFQPGQSDVHGVILHHQFPGQIPSICSDPDDIHHSRP
jgi:hypothetical protein